MIAVGVYVWHHREHHEKEHIQTVELHKNWRALRTVSKRLYYFNTETGETSWTPPSNAIVLDAPNATTDGEGHYLPPGWNEGEHDSEVFYYHDDGESTSWEFPDWIPEGWVPPENTTYSQTSTNDAVNHQRTATTHVVDASNHTWVVAEADAGQKYYFNETAGLSEWVKPEGMSIYNVGYGAEDNDNIAVAMESNPMRQ